MLYLYIYIYISHISSGAEHWPRAPWQAPWLSRLLDAESMSILEAVVDSSRVTGDDR